MRQATRWNPGLSSQHGTRRGCQNGFDLVARELERGRTNIVKGCDRNARRESVIGTINPDHFAIVILCAAVIVGLGLWVIFAGGDLDDD